jgi:hypothetical protein
VPGDCVRGRYLNFPAADEMPPKGDVLWEYLERSATACLGPGPGADDWATVPGAVGLGSLATWVALGLVGGWGKRRIRLVQIGCVMTVAALSLLCFSVLKNGSLTIGSWL